MKIENTTEFKVFMKNLRWLRQKHGLSKCQMAKLLHVSMRTLDKIEREELPLHSGVQVIFNACSAFHIHPKLLFSLDFSSLFDGAGQN